MARVLAIDYGAKRSGIAVTDPLRMIASPHTTVPTHELMKYLKDYFQKEEVSEVVFGMPKQLDGSDTNATSLVNAAINRFKKLFPNMLLFLHDERFTSKMALDAMIVGGTSKKTRRNKGNIDKVSAAIILQSYLEANS
jgi:putative Holliday junction resolvase